MLLRILLLSLAFLLTLVPRTAAAVDEVFVTPEGALRGYDVVAYHTEQRAVPGLAAYTHDWNGARWRFANAANRDAFAADPARYAPQYGGYCAYGLAQGYKVGTDPKAFAVVDGKLYLNYSPAVQRTWNGDRAGYIRTADGNWVRLAASPYAPPAG
jgi:hypothetical protein